MTDTPPFYWLNGEDGPQEEEDDDSRPPDGVLAARPVLAARTLKKQSNGQLEGLDLSRNQDRKRHGYTSDLSGPPSAVGDPSASVNRSGMPGGGLRPPGPLTVPGLAQPLQQFDMRVPGNLGSNTFDFLFR